jgi:HD-like signal output (HDOD) protein
MHDIGSLIMFKEFPQTMAYAIGLSHQGRVPLFQVEQEVLGYDHARVGGLILEKWNFPSLLIQMIRYHHSPLKCKSPLEPAVIDVANIMAGTLRFGDSGNPFASPFEKSVWDTIGLPPGIFNSSIKQADRQVYEILTAFRPDNMNKE